MGGVGVYFGRSRCKVIDSIPEVADITFADCKQALTAGLFPPIPRRSPLNPGLWKTICDTVSKGRGEITFNKTVFKIRRFL
jgi:hypothetical protein